MAGFARGGNDILLGATGGSTLFGDAGENIPTMLPEGTTP